MRYLTSFLVGLLFLGLFSCDTTPPPPKAKLKVKATNVAKYSVKKLEGDGNYTKDAFDATHLVQLTYFDEKGQLSKKSWSDLDRSIIFYLATKSDERGYIATGVLQGKGKNILSRMEYEVDEKGQKVKESRFSAKKKLEKTDEFFYDEKGFLVREIRKNANGDVLETTYYKNNEQGDVTEMTIEYANHQTYIETYDYKLFNEHGDWTQRYVLVDGEVTHLMERNVYYFEKK